MLTSELGEEEEWDLRDLRDRLVAIPREPWQHFPEVSRTHDEFMVVGREMLRSETCSRALVVYGIFESHRERREGLGAGLSCKREDGSGVNSAAQENPDGNVAHQASSGGRKQKLSEFARFQFARLLGGIDLPIPRDVEVGAVVGGAMRRRKPIDARKERLRRDDVSLKEVFGDHRLVDLRPLTCREKDRSRVRSERDAILVLLDVERLLPESVARQEQNLAPHIPDRESEHSVEVLRQVGSPLLVAVNEYFGVRARREPMTAAGEIIAQRIVVPDLAVVHGDNAPVLVLHRLAAAVEVDDAQSSEAESNPLCLIDAGLVRPSVGKRGNSVVQTTAVRR